MKIENFKMKVTPEQSKRVQEVCGVSHGWKADYIIWYGNEMKFCITRDHFDAHPHAELPYDEFMAKYAPLPKYGGEIKDFPPHVVRAMGIQQVKQGNEWDISVFETMPWAGVESGGFTWTGGMFWHDVIQKRQFDLIPEEPEADRMDIMARDDHNPPFPPKQDEAPECMQPMPLPPRINPAHLAIAFRIFGPYNDVEDIAKIVNIVLENVELFEKLRGLENESNR